MKLILFFCLLNIAFAVQAEKSYSNLTESEFTAAELADQTNLALRQVGDQLLRLSGNRTSTVAPIQQLDEHIFLLPLKHSFNYDTLPTLLHAALTDFEMEKESYYVSVKNCETDTLILGFDARQFLAGNVPCIGRHQYADCNRIFVTFPNRKMLQTANSNWAYLLLLPVLLGLYFFTKKAKQLVKPEVVEHRDTSDEATNHLLHFGQSRLDFINQHLYLPNSKKELTFREAKLLHYFASNLNQLLKREDLLDEVWGDEGVIVGRSLDVFVSRLRKILRADASLQIKTVHGVGYRLEEVK
ncbi:MAG: winged helix-turn-helix domain-containing protein, partial [Saprospiraceae bacterium]